MIAAVISVPQRAKSLAELRALIEPSVSSFQVFMDVCHQGHWWNYERAFRQTVDVAPPGTAVLLMTDDVTTVPDWRERWEAIHATAGGKIYTLFNRQRHLFKPENLARGFVKGSFPRGFYDPATIFIDKPNLMAAAMRWFYLEGGREHPRVTKRRKHLDVVIQEFLILHHIEWTVTTPTLFDHKSIASTVGNKIGRSPCYIGDL